MVHHKAIMAYNYTDIMGFMGDDGNSTPSLKVITTPTPIGNATMTPSLITEPPCQWILFEDIGSSRVRIWDLIILVPNAIFLLFLIINSRVGIAKLRTTSSPIFAAFYILVFIVAAFSVLRCIVSMTVNASVLAGDIADKALWLVLRFFLLATEMSVIVFGLAFGHLDSRTSIHRVLIVTFSIALIYSMTQGTLEFIYPDPKFHVHRKGSTGDQNYDIFGHGGMIFWFISSLIFFVIYTCIFCLPHTTLRDRLALPSKKSFYYYAAFLSVLNGAQVVGSALLYYDVLHGMCVVDTTAFLYFAAFDPLVYGTFLGDFFRNKTQSIAFSYKPQLDDAPGDDTVSLPHQTMYDQPPEENDSCSSTHFDQDGNVMNYDMYYHPIN